MKPKAAWELVRQAFGQWSEDRAPRMGAALAFYSTFSIAPLLIIVIAVAGFVFGEQAARGEIVKEIGGTIGEPAARALEGMIHNAATMDGGGIAMVVGIVVLIVGATGVFVELQDALNTIWKVEPKPGSTLRRLIRARLLSFSLVLAFGFLLLVSLVLSAALSAIAKFLTPVSLPGGAYLWESIHLAMSLGIFTLLLALIFKVLPDVVIPWRDVWVGAVTTAGLFMLGKHLIGLYLGQGSVASAYGAAGALVVLLLWVYYNSLVLFFGVEFTRAFAYKHGSRVVPTDYAVPAAASPQAATRA